MKSDVPNERHRPDADANLQRHIRDQSEADSERTPDRPLARDAQRRQFDGPDAAAELQLGEAANDGALTRAEAQQHFGRDSDAAAERQLRAADDNHIETAAERLRLVRTLQPEVWQDATAAEREWALHAVNREMGTAFGCGALPLEFREFDGPLLGQTEVDGTSVLINSRFLDASDVEFSEQFGHVSHAVGTVAHEYRHYYQEEQVLRSDGPLRPELPSRITDSWRQGRELYTPGGALDADSDSVAKQLCRRLYGDASAYRGYDLDRPV